MKLLLSTLAAISSVFGIRGAIAATPNPTNPTVETAPNQLTESQLAVLSQKLDSRRFQTSHPDLIATEHVKAGQKDRA